MGMKPSSEKWQQMRRRKKRDLKGRRNDDSARTGVGKKQVGTWIDGWKKTYREEKEV